MAPSGHYKLFHFDVRGRAEPIRLILLANGVPFEDIRMSVKEYIKFKPEIPLRNFPMLVTPNGEKICQPITILRYLGRKFDMLGRDHYDEAQIDLAIYSANDICEETRAICQLWETNAIIDTEKRDKNRQFFMDKVLPNTMTSMEKLLIQGGNGWLIGDKMSIADLYLIHWIEEVCLIHDRSVFVQWDKHPDLRALNERVRASPGIREWLRTRPNDAEEIRNLTITISELRKSGEAVKL